MKTIFGGILLFLVLETCFHQPKDRITEGFGSPSTDVVAADTVYTHSFESDIMPIFKAKCSPCHFPGGKMSVKMPFDKPQTFKDHREGILNRMKNNTDIDRIRTFIEGLP